MAKSTVHKDKLGTFDNFRAPWQTETGEDAEIDQPKLAKLIYNLKLDLANERDKHEDTKATLTEVETERDEAKDAAANANGPEAQKQIDKLTADLEKVTGERDDLKNEKAAAELRAEVLGDFETRHPKAAKYVKGDTEEELRESLKDVMEDFGITEGDGDDEDAGDDEDEPKLSTRPRSQSLLNPGDKNNGKGGDEEVDFDKVAAQIQGGRIFG